MTKLLLDVGLPRRAAGDLRQQGFDAEHASDLGQSIVVSNEELTQTDRLSYVLAHGVKEGLVESTSQ